MQYELFNDKTSRRKVVSCVTSCHIQLFRTNFAYDMSHPTCRIVCHRHNQSYPQNRAKQCNATKERDHIPLETPNM